MNMVCGFPTSLSVPGPSSGACGGSGNPPPPGGLPPGNPLPPGGPLLGGLPPPGNLSLGALHLRNCLSRNLPGKLASPGASLGGSPVRKCCTWYSPLGGSGQSDKLALYMATSSSVVI
jgi:hypothetical protein